MEEIKEELTDIVQEPDVQEIVDSEAVESAQEVFDELQNSIDQEIEENEGNEEIPSVPVIPLEPEIPVEPEIPGEGANPVENYPDRQSEADFGLPEVQPEEPEGFNQPVENEPVEQPVPNDPWFDAPNRWAAGQENQEKSEESELAAENAENSENNYENAENSEENSLESESYEQTSNEEAPVEQPIAGIELGKKLYFSKKLNNIY